VRPRNIIVPFFLIAGLVLIPWTVWLTFSLPGHHETADWRTVWAGFDAAEAAALIGTAFAALRGSPWLEAVAAVAGTLLCTDAWFDITLEFGGRHMTASIVEAALLELPLAAICFWVAHDAERALSRAMPPWHRAALRALAEPPTFLDVLPGPDPESPRPRTQDPHQPGVHSPTE
jgi:hypothetical protein